MREIRLDLPMPLASLRLVLAEVARRNRVGEGLLYMQVGRGVARNPRLDIKAGLGHPDGRVGFRVEVSEADWDAILRHPEGLSVVLLHPAAAAASTHGW